MDYLWTHLNTGATTIEMDFQCRHELGVHGYHLTVTDNHRAHESDVISFEVAPADRVPGVCMCMHVHACAACACAPTFKLAHLFVYVPY